MTETVYYNDQIFARILNEHPNLAGITCQDNTLQYNNESCNLNYFKISDVVTNAFTLNKEEFFEFIKINVAATNLLHEQDIFEIKKEIDDAIFENNSELVPQDNEAKVKQLLNNKTYMEKYKDYYSGEVDALYQIYNNAINNALNSPKQTNGIDIIKQTYPNGIGNVVSNKDIHAYQNTRNNPYVRKLTPPTKKAGYINFVLILYIIVNITIILVVSLFK